MNSTQTQALTQTALPTETATPTLTPTVTQVPFYLNATVWDENLQVPILIYHEFVPYYEDVDATHTRLNEFKDQLQTFYDNGFRLISLKDWINGTFVLPEGKKPLIITIDDLWFGNQIYIEDNGIPSIYSGIGVLWKFSQDHPDFGFHAALFAINGDKFYPEKQVGDHFYAADNIDWYSLSWHIKLGNTIAWAIDHGLEVYNHTLHHYYYWTSLTDEQYRTELSDNDVVLREFLTESGHSDLIPKLDNVIALPQGLWPDSYSGKQIILNYKNTEGKPLLAVMEAYNLNAAQLTPSHFSDKFDPFHVARITVSKYMVQYIINHQDQVPTMLSCKLGPLDESQAANPDVIQAAIQSAVTTKVCSEGVYDVSGYVFLAKNGTVTLYQPADSGNSSAVVTVTPTITP
jgi:hypothetical protein